MRIDVLTLFPTMFENVLGESMIKRAQNKGLVKIRLYNLREWTFDSHRSADDKPFGGGPGMVMKIEPVYLALKEIGLGNRLSVIGDRVGPKTQNRKPKARTRVILLTPQGKRLNQNLAKKLAAYSRLVLICGHYEGVDERIRSLVDEEVSIGDYVLTCGELPAMVLIDSIVRLIPGVLGGDESLRMESFENNLLEYPQYTRPASFLGMRVPGILISGNHKSIEEWRKTMAMKRTAERRPDLINP